jgi:hypothetical protein
MLHIGAFFDVIVSLSPTLKIFDCVNQTRPHRMLDRRAFSVLIRFDPRPIGFSLVLMDISSKFRILSYSVRKPLSLTRYPAPVGSATFSYTSGVFLQDAAIKNAEQLEARAVCKECTFGGLRIGDPESRGAALASMIWM